MINVITILLNKFSDVISKLLGVQFAKLRQSNLGLFILSVIVSAITYFQTDLVSVVGDWSNIINTILVLIAAVATESSTKK